MLRFYHSKDNPSFCVRMNLPPIDSQRINRQISASGAVFLKSLRPQQGMSRAAPGRISGGCISRRAASFSGRRRIMSVDFCLDLDFYL
ncbi:MAG TPA: hypothetical protein PKV67_17820 [Hyphomonas sp.]|nr:hypothetical protein [Hyphomonas sp.]